MIEVEPERRNTSFESACRCQTVYRVTDDGVPAADPGEKARVAVLEDDPAMRNLLKRLLDPDDLGHAVTNEVRKQAYAIISNEHEREREKWNASN